MGEGRGLKALNAEGDDLSHLRQISKDKSHSLSLLTQFLSLGMEAGSGFRKRTKVSALAPESFSTQVILNRDRGARSRL